MGRDASHRPVAAPAPTTGRRTAGVARRNVAELALPVTVRTVAVETLARTAAERAYDVVFADPPYELTTVDDLVADVVSNGWLADNGLVVVERSARTAPPAWPDVLAERWQKTYGETMLCFAQR